jgi:hypothetical protein
MKSYELTDEDKDKQQDEVHFERIGSAEAIFGLLEGDVTVRYHEDRCTKNKRMIRIPKHGLFLTCTENSFLFCTHIQ